MMKMMMDKNRKRWKKKMKMLPRKHHDVLPSHCKIQIMQVVHQKKPDVLSCYMIVCKRGKRRKTKKKAKQQILLNNCISNSKYNSNNSKIKAKRKIVCCSLRGVDV